MQFFTAVPSAALDDFTKSANNQPDDNNQPKVPYVAQAIWPDYFARKGQADALNWHYRGYWSDTRHVWSSYYRFIVTHPVVAYTGLRQFYRNLSYRVFGAAVGDRCAAVISMLTSILLLLTPPLALLAVTIACIPVVKRRMPPLFQPFSLMGWCNYCVMLSLVFMLHGHRQHTTGLRPAKVAQHSSKTFWNKFFNRHLPADQFATEICATCSGGKFTGKLPRAAIIVKPNSSGAGHHLRSYAWQAEGGIYTCKDSELGKNEPAELTPEELENRLIAAGLDMVVEHRVWSRRPLPVSSLRILTLHVGTKAELICAAFLPAPTGSVSTAYFDLEIYLVDYQNSQIGEPLATHCNGSLRGVALPELNDVITTCLQLHERMKEHLQISWDVMLTDKGPIFLEGNVFPPGCDYKLTLFKNKQNFRYLTKRLLQDSSSSTTDIESAVVT